MAVIHVNAKIWNQSYFIEHILHCWTNFLGFIWSLCLKKNILIHKHKSIGKLSSRFIKETKKFHNTTLKPAVLRPEAWCPKEQMVKGTPNVFYIIQLYQAMCQQRMCVMLSYCFFHYYSRLIGEKNQKRTPHYQIKTTCMFLKGSYQGVERVFIAWG